MKLRDRLIFSVATFLVLITIFLVLDIETMLTGSRSLLINSKSNVQPSRGRHTFIQRHLQKTTNGSRESAAFGSAQKYNGINSLDDQKNQYANGKSQANLVDYDSPPSGAPQPQPKSSPTTSTTPPPPPDPFTDLVAVVLKIDKINARLRKKKQLWNPNLGELLGLELR